MKENLYPLKKNPSLDVDFTFLSSDVDEEFESESSVFEEDDSDHSINLSGSFSFDLSDQREQRARLFFSLSNKQVTKPLLITRPMLVPRSCNRIKLKTPLDFYIASRQKITYPNLFFLNSSLREEKIWLAASLLEYINSAKSENGLVDIIDVFIKKNAEAEIKLSRLPSFFANRFNNGGRLRRDLMAMKKLIKKQESTSSTISALAVVSAKPFTYPQL